VNNANQTHQKKENLQKLGLKRTTALCGRGRERPQNSPNPTKLGLKRKRALLWRERLQKPTKNWRQRTVLP